MKDRLGLFALIAGMFALPAVSGYEITGIPVFGLLEDFAQNPLGNVLLVKLLYIAIIATMLRWLFSIIFFSGKQDASGEKYATTIAVLMGVMAGVFTPAEAMASLMGFVGSWVGLLILGVAVYFIVYLAFQGGRRLGELDVSAAVRWVLVIALIIFLLNFLGWLGEIATEEWLAERFTQAIDWTVNIASLLVILVALGTAIWHAPRAARRIRRGVGGAARHIGSGARNAYDRARQRQAHNGVAPTSAQEAREQAEQNHAQQHAQRAQQHERRGERDERRAQRVERKEEQATEEAVQEEEQERKDVHMLSQLLAEIAHVTSSVQVWSAESERRQRISRYVARFDRFLGPIKRESKRLRHTFRRLKRLDDMEHRFLAKGNHEFTWLRRDLKQDPALRDEQVEEIVQRVYARHKQLRARYEHIREAIKRGAHEQDMIDKELRASFKQLDSVEGLWNGLYEAIETHGERPNVQEGGTVREGLLRRVHATTADLAQKMHLIEEKLVELERITRELAAYEKDEDVLLMRELRRARGSRQQLHAVLQRYSG